MRTSAVLSLAIAVFVAGGCSRPPEARAARYHHFTFLAFQDPSVADAVIRDCRAHLPKIPGVVAVHCGKPVDVGRPAGEVTADFHVGVYVAFETLEGLKGYADHPEHRRVVETWGPKVARIRVHDVEGVTP
jgi:hypothetical protein